MKRFVSMLVLPLMAFSLAQAQDSEQETDALQEAANVAQEAEESSKDREQSLAEYLNGIKFVGKFTIDGRDNAEPKTEEYTISKCEKLDRENMYG